MPLFESKERGASRGVNRIRIGRCIRETHGACELHSYFNSIVAISGAMKASDGRCILRDSSSADRSPIPACNRKRLPRRRYVASNPKQVSLIRHRHVRDTCRIQWSQETNKKIRSLSRADPRSLDLCKCISGLFSFPRR